MIQLETTTGLTVWINPAHIVFMFAVETGGTVLTLSPGIGQERVKQSPEEILRLVRNGR